MRDAYKDKQWRERKTPLASDEWGKPSPSKARRLKRTKKLTARSRVARLEAEGSRP